MREKQREESQLATLWRRQNMSLQLPRLGHRSIVDYSVESWCTKCYEPKRKEANYCPDCGYKLRHRSYNNRKKPKRFAVKSVDYTTHTYCGKCGERRPKDAFRCSECGRQLRHHPLKSQQK